MVHKRKRKNQKKEPRPDNRDSKPRQATYENLVKENGNFDQFYKAQKIVSSEEEWTQLIDCLKSDLPSAFRITSGLPETKFLQKIVEGKYFTELLKNTEAKAPLCIPWYPEGLAWQLEMSRVKIRKFDEYKRLHKFLISECDNGNISRQETVSMIPPVVLDIQPGHKVLDMCAAPGSKTSQIIEMLHRGGTKVPDGLVVANDVDNKRCYMLMHQAKRLRSSCLMVVNHDASQLPNLKLANGETLKYDRVLCDVPCTGDGTLRKNGDLWRKWNTANGNSIHGLQIRIARRGLESLVVGGLMVYSTCSLNPIENEAVIVRLLEEAQGAVEIVDVREKLPGLKSNPGLKDWIVASKEVDIFKSFDDVPEALRTQVTAKLFPPSAEQIESYNLERCLRILPHLQDTGGFFVVLLKKLRPLPWESQKAYVGGDTVKSDEKPAEPTETEVTEDPKSLHPERVNRKLKKPKGFREDPYIFIDPKDEAVVGTSKFYEFSDDFPASQLLCRTTEGQRRNIYLVSKIIKEILDNNGDRLKVINTGVRVFSRAEGREELGCDFRIAQEGLSTMMPYLGNSRKLNLSLDDVKVMLNHEFPLETLYSAELKAKVENLQKGCVIITYTSCKGEPEEFDVSFSGRLGKATLRCYIAKQERPHYQRLCGLDDTEECESVLERDKLPQASPQNDEEEDVTPAKRPLLEIQENSNETVPATN